MEGHRGSPDSGLSGNSSESKEQVDQGLSWTGACALFAATCFDHLRIVLTASPFGASLRHYLRQIPAILHRCCINWYHDWPASGFQSIATQLLDAQEGAGPKLPDEC